MQLDRHSLGAKVGHSGFEGPGSGPGWGSQQPLAQGRAGRVGAMGWALYAGFPAPRGPRELKPALGTSGTRPTSGSHGQRSTPLSRATHLGDGSHLPLKDPGVLGRGDEGWWVGDGGWARRAGPGPFMQAQGQRMTCRARGCL